MRNKPDTKNNSGVSAFKNWLLDNGRSVKTAERYARTAGAFIESTGKSLASIEPADVGRYKEYQIKTNGKQALKIKLIALRQLFKFLERYDLLDRPEKFPSITTRFTTETINAEEYRKLKNAAKESGKTRLYLLIRALASSGLRVVELKYITVDAVKAGTAVASNEKKPRKIYIPPLLRQELLDYCKDCHLSGKDVVFFGKTKSKSLDNARIWRELKAVADSAGVPQEKVNGQCFRLFFSKQYMSKYGDAYELASILGLRSTVNFKPMPDEDKMARITELNL